MLSTNVLEPVVSGFAGERVSLAQLVRAASAVQAAYRDHGYPDMSVIVGPEGATNGVVTMSVCRGAFPQVVVSGTRYLLSSNAVTAAANPTPEELAHSRETTAATAPSRTNAAPTFEVEEYLVHGNTLLAPETIARALTNAPGAFGTNVTFAGIQSALTELQQAYRARGYVTASVGLPQQRLTNATVKVEVTEGKLAAVKIVGNHYFSSNNIRRALPSLRTNAILNGLIFQAEVNRANANRDRQLSAVIAPGAEPGTSDLILNVKDRLPLHGKLELNNQSSPGTPDLRLNASAAYDNLWQEEHSAGVQYAFSPEYEKQGSQWNFYDVPLVANYGGFYRWPLGQPEPVAEVVASNPTSFGYSEASRRFVLPPPSGQAELTVYASRATIDTGVQTLSHETLLDIPGVRQISREDIQQDLTVNEALGLRLTKPFRGTDQFHPGISGGLDFKSYSLSDFKTNSFILSEITYGPDGRPNPPVVSVVNSPVPTTERTLEYLPLSLAYNTTWQIPRTTFGFDLGLSANAWYSGAKGELQTLTGSKDSSGHWVAVDPSLTADIVVHTNWVLTVRANGRWASEPLISNEQFGAGGLASVRGYHEGEVFGDTGWHASIEQKTPPHVVGFVAGKLPVVVRGSIYMDYAETYLLDPQGRPGSTPLWGTGIGMVASIGAHWETRFLFSVPLLDAGTISAYQPFFNFALTAQF